MTRNSDFNNFSQRIDPSHVTRLEEGDCLVFDNTGGKIFHLRQEDILRVLPVIREKNAEIETFLNGHPEHVSGKEAWDYQEGPYRDLFKRSTIFDEGNHNAFVQMAGSQTKALLTAVNKIIGFNLGRTDCGPNDRLLLDMDSLDRFFNVVPEPQGETPEEPNPVPREEFIKKFAEFIEGSLVVDEGILRSFIVSLATKPFVILTGNSGTGKTRLARDFAAWVCGERTDGYRVIPVGSDWTDNRNVLGFMNMLRKDPDGKDGVFQSTPVLDLILRAGRDPDNPYFLILDEMNLSHVERYFSDFLSGMESGEGIPVHSEDRPVHTSSGEILESGEIRIPKNLFIVGTVNVDETTYMFSPKVLDRANVIEFSPDPESFARLLPRGRANTNPQGAAGRGKTFLEASLSVRGFEEAGEPLTNLPGGYSETAGKFLKEIFEILKKRNMEYGYRTVIEISRYLKADYNFRAVAATSGEDPDMLKGSFDRQILQKILPKFHGSRKKLETVLVALECYLEKGDLEEAIAALDTGKCGERSGNACFFPLSRKRVEYMLEVLRREQFVSFIS